MSLSQNEPFNSSYIPNMPANQSWSRPGDLPSTGGPPFIYMHNYGPGMTEFLPLWDCINYFNEIINPCEVDKSGATDGDHLSNTQGGWLDLTGLRILIMLQTGPLIAPGLPSSYLPIPS